MSFWDNSSALPVLANRLLVIMDILNVTLESVGSVVARLIISSPSAKPSCVRCYEVLINQRKSPFKAAGPYVSKSEEN